MSCRAAILKPRTSYSQSSDTNTAYPQLLCEDMAENMPVSRTTKEKYRAFGHTMPTPEIKRQDFIVNKRGGNTASTTVHDWHH